LECQNQKTAAQRPSGVLLPIVRLLKVRIVHLYADVLSLTVR
jgi:tRNA (Thr-GGU) A37 N-methylase